MRRWWWLLMVFPALAAGYRPATVAEAVKGEATGRVRIYGRYLAFGAFVGRVDGVLSDGHYALRLEGQVFDLVPVPGGFYEVWGELAADSLPRLRFHNARPPGADREPRPAADLPARGRVRVWLRVYDAGGAVPERVGVSEDGLFFHLPGYRGPVGVRCLVGQRVAEAVLAGAKECGR